MEILNQRLSATTVGVAIILLIVLTASFWILSSDDSPSQNSGPVPTATVLKGPFDIYITETAILDAGRSITLSSDLPSNKAKVLELATEGNPIDEGMIVAKFDPTPFNEEIQKIRRDIREEETKLLQEEAELELQGASNQDRLDRLQYQLELAELKLKKLKKSDIPIRKARMERELDHDNSEYVKAKSSLNSQRELFAGGFTTARKLQEAIDKERELGKVFEITRSNADMLETIEIPGQLKRAELNLESRKSELKSANRSLQQKYLKQKAAINRSQSKLGSLKESLQQQINYLDRTTIRAPVSGLVLYKIISFQNEKRKVQVGDSLWNRHGFAVIPDMSSMIGNVNIRESDVGKLAKGQVVEIRPEAYSNLILKGNIDAIGTLASNDANTTAAKFFQVRIKLLKTSPKLRPGMSARASILTSHYDDVIYIPVEAVFYDKNEAVCFIWNDGDPQRVSVSLGDSDGTYVVINEGLNAGDQIMLVYPNQFDS